VSGAYGIQGWVRIKPYSDHPDALLSARTWWLDKPDVHDVEMMQAKLHGGEVVACLMGIAERNAAEALKGAAIKISRSHFPALSDGEFYWIDLVGLKVDNLQGQHLGQVTGLLDNGAHPILQVAVPQNANREAVQNELLIPFVDQFVRTVDQQARKIVVDWGLDY
jgi:16S rRNA processing protein RimM